jgi:hypothetical protein
LVLEDGKYRLTYFWSSQKGRISTALSIKDIDKKNWNKFNPDKNIWEKSPERNRFFTVKGTPGKWNKMEFEFTLDFPRSHGYLFFRGSNNDTLNIDDVLLEKIVK